MRKLYIDNLRWSIVLLLFPYHIFMIYNNFESFYIHGIENDGLSRILGAVWPWFMPVLFVIAGISSAYALQKRSGSEYLKERILKLLVPLIFGILLLVPIQSYMAELFHNGKGNYWNYFTQISDLTGYAGGFTPGHLWFILYLFAVSLLALPIMLNNKINIKKLRVQGLSVPYLLLLFLIPLFMQVVLDIKGKSVGEYFAFFMLGYYILSQEGILAKLDRYRLFLFGTFLLGFLFMFLYGEALYGINQYLYEVTVEFYAWVAVLALIGMSRHYLDFQNNITRYLSKSSFGIYLFHQSWIVCVAYYTFNISQNTGVQILLIMLGSIPLTFFTYELCKRIRILRFIFGLNK